MGKVRRYGRKDKRTGWQQGGCVRKRRGRQEHGRRLAGPGAQGPSIWVCVLDADSTNVGLHRALGPERSPAPLIEYFGATVFSGSAVSCPVDDPTPLPGAQIWLDRLPGTYCAQSPEGISLLTAGKIGGQGPGAGCDGPVSKITRDLRVHGNRRLVTLTAQSPLGWCMRMTRLRWLG
jgi:hypothetical protein